MQPLNANNKSAYLYWRTTRHKNFNKRGWGKRFELRIRYQSNDYAYAVDMHQTQTVSDRNIYIYKRIIKLRLRK